MKKHILCATMLLIITSAFSSAHPETTIETPKTLEQVDTLIAARRINEALTVVESYLRENPDDFDNARKRINIIFELRNDYKKKADELINIIVEDPLNDKRKLDIIAELENMEVNPNKEEQEFISKIKTSAQFTYFRALYEKIIEEATVLLNNNDYLAAVEKLSEGFILYYDDFFDKGFDEKIVSNTVKTLASLETSFVSYGQLQYDLNTSFENFNKALLANDISTSLQEYENVQKDLTIFSALYNKNILTGFSFQDTTEVLKKQTASLTDAFFLPFAYRLILGRENEEEAYIVKVMEKQWNDLYELTLINLSGMITNLSQKLTGALTSQNLEEITINNDLLQTKVKDLSKTLAMGQDFLMQYNILNQTKSSFKTNPHVQFANLLEYNDYLLTQSENLFTNALTLSKQHDSIASFVIPKNPDSIIQTKDTAYKDFSFQSSKTSFDQFQLSMLAVTALQEEALRFTKQALPSTEAEKNIEAVLLDLETNLENNFTEIANKNYTQSLSSLEEYASFIENGSTIIRTTYQEPYTNAVAKINTSLDTSVKSNPEQSIVIFDELFGRLETDLSALHEVYTTLESLPENSDVEIEKSSSFIEDSRIILSNINYLENLRIDSKENYSLAEQRLRLAQQAENEALLRISQARRYLNQQDFLSSRETIQAARTKYNESLSYQYSDDLLAESDELIASLGEEISYAENEVIVQRVRTFITDSRKNYYNSNFLQAENLILQAESQWAITHVEENPEIVSLKALISNALSITTGRSIPATDPLYPEMSQTLNVAYQHYSNAESFLRKNNRTEALLELESARNKIRDIQVLYPFHQEASLLALEIDKLIDPVAFEQQFTRKFEQAQKDYKDPDTSTRAYIDLLDLHKINPNYPGLERFIYIVELDLGIILPPPDYAALARSTSLTEEAQSLYNSGVRNEITLSNASNLLSEAIELNPENQDALILLDRINTSLGSGAVIVLSSETENLYQQAVLELSNGNIITAAALVSQLLQIDGVENSSKIIDLKKRLDALL